MHCDYIIFLIEGIFSGESLSINDTWSLDKQISIWYFVL